MMNMSANVCVFIQKCKLMKNTVQCVTCVCLFKAQLPGFTSGRLHPIRESWEIRYQHLGKYSKKNPFLITFLTYHTLCIHPTPRIRNSCCCSCSGTKNTGVMVLARVMAKDVMDEVKQARKLEVKLWPRRGL